MATNDRPGSSAQVRIQRDRIPRFCRSRGPRPRVSAALPTEHKHCLMDEPGAGGSCRNAMQQADGASGCVRSWSRIWACRAAERTL